MKLFAVYADLDLIQVPKWLNDYRAKYDKPYPFHITLKQTCYVEDEQVDVVKVQLSAFLHSLNSPAQSFNLKFDHIVTDEADGSIMLASASNEALLKLQRNLVNILNGYKYYEPQSEAWERDFRPHITIARDLTPELMERAKTEIQTSDMPVGTINMLTLVVVNDPSPGEAKLPENLTHFHI